MSRIAYEITLAITSSGDDLLKRAARETAHDDPAIVTFADRV